MVWERECSVEYGTVWKASVGVTAQCENMTNSCCHRRVEAGTERLALLSELFVLFVVIIITVFARITDFSRKRNVKNQ